MNDKRLVRDAGVAGTGPGRAWPPTCEKCGWSGPADEHGTPYVDCGGVESRHLREALRSVLRRLDGATT